MTTFAKWNFEFFSRWEGYVGLAPLQKKLRTIFQTAARIS